MIRLSIRTKLAVLLSALSLLLVVAMLWVVKSSFDKGFQAYLNEAVTRKMQGLAASLSTLAEKPEAWKRLTDEHRQWEHYLHEYYRSQERDERRGVSFGNSAPPADSLGDALPPHLNDESNQFAPMPRHPPGPGRRERPADDGSLQSRESRRGEHRFGHPPPPPPRAGQAVWLLDQHQQILLGPPLPGRDPKMLLNTPVKTGNQIVGYVAWRAVRPFDNAADAMFAEQQHRLFLLIALAAVLSSIVLSWPISRYLVNPVQTLSSAMQALMRRQYDKRVPVASNDELGDLAKDFNLMAQTLEEHDSQQRQWLADISHELRTPLGVLKGELEAVQDGVMPLDEDTVGSLVDEVAQLSRLVDDLHQLAVTQATHLRYRLEPLDLAELIARLKPRLENLMCSANLNCEINLPSRGIWVEGDSQRLEQLIMNLAQNSVRYTHPGGRVRLRADVADKITLYWEDSEPGVDAADMAHLFDRFYRVEKSRQRALGGSGLGLSIVANIAAAHNAELRARPSEWGGLLIEISFNPSGRRI